MQGVITLSLIHERYYKWAEILFKSILNFTSIDFALVYDNEEYLKKYNLDKLVKYPIKKTDIDNPYLYKYKLIECTPFSNTIFFDADTVITKNIQPLFNTQSIAVYGEWDKEWLYNDFSFINNPELTVKKHNLKKLYSAYSGYLRFEDSTFYKELFNNVIGKVHHDNYFYKIYKREVMPDEYFLNLSITELELKKFTPIQLAFSKNLLDEDEYYGYSYQGTGKVESNKAKDVLELLDISLNEQLI